jgi:hypothetical protein
VQQYKWLHIPAPVAIEEDISWEYSLQFAAGGGFADAHRTAYDDEFFHKIDYLTGNYE